MIDFVSIPEQRVKLLKTNRKIVKKLEGLANVKITFAEGEDIQIECEDPVQLMCVKNIIKAFGRSFAFEDALYLLDDEYELCIIDITEFSGKSSDRLNELRGRVIGREGKTKNIIEKFTDVKLSIYGKTICIIGKWNSVQFAREAICMLLEGRKHGTVYNFLFENANKIK